MRKKNIPNVIGTPETKTVRVVYKPWTLLPDDGSYSSWDGCGWPVWSASNRDYADVVFGSLADAMAWLEEELNWYVKRINTRQTYGFYGDKFIKGSAKLVKKGNAMRVTAKFEAPRFVNGVQWGNKLKSETYAKGGVKVVRL